MIPKMMHDLHEGAPPRERSPRRARAGGRAAATWCSAIATSICWPGWESTATGSAPSWWPSCGTSESPHAIGGYLVVDNLSMGTPSMGGIRMLPELVPAEIHNLARGMTLKNAAASLPFGGGKAGIVSDPDLTPEIRIAVIRGFARLIRLYRDLYVPGPDVGTNDADMHTVAIENGIDSAVSKPADMGGNRIDELGAAAGGVVIALERLLEIMPRLTVLPQFAQLKIPPPEALTVSVQGFGAVGAHAARILAERLPDARVVGVSDLDGLSLRPRRAARRSAF